MVNGSALFGAAISVFLTGSLLYPEAVAHAGTITFNDLTDDVTVADTTGRITSSTCSDEHCFVTFSAPPNTVSASGTGTAVNVREPAVGPISDVVISNFSSSAGTIEFVSDVEGIVLDPVPGSFIVESGTVQNVASVTWTLGDGSTVVDTIGFISDVSEAPEPNGIALLGFGLIGLGLIRYSGRVLQRAPGAL